MHKQWKKRIVSFIKNKKIIPLKKYNKDKKIEYLCTNHTDDTDWCTLNPYCS